MTELFIFIVLWLVSGTSGFIYWWTQDFDFKLSDVSVALLASTLGPMAFTIGYAVHGSPQKIKSITLIKKREN